MATCLDTAWAAQFKKAGKPFSPPRIRIYTKRRDYCGKHWAESLMSDYCPRDRTVVFLLTAPLVKEPSRLSGLMSIAHEYGHHVQELSGIRDAYARLPRRDAGERHEQARRYDLQAECLAGVFAGSAWASLKRPRSDWDTLLLKTAQGGDDYWGTHEYGEGASIVFWLVNGFTHVSPRFCNTWVAGPSTVA
ncbi:neutral zinc metallopeptidase [Streptosporangium sp. NPDC004631]